MSPGRDNLASLGTPERLGDLPLLPMPAGAPIFEQTLEYFSPQHAQPRYAGNIAETSWRRGNAEADTYAYTYDRLGRLVDSRIICSGTRLKFYGERDISYDKNTNILSLTRYNGLLTGTQYRYTYDGNRKLSVTSDASTETATDYGYQYDIMRNISKIGAENLLISYNYLNLPKQVTKMWAPRTEGAATYVVGVIRPTASYLYLADGTKVQAIGETGQGYEYVGSLRLSVNGSNVDIESIPFAGGRIVKTTNGYEPHYYITDHLGSTRTIVKPKATVVAEFDYMPYGTQHAVATAPTTEADYKYTGKEQQGAFGLDNLYDSQARFQYVTDGMFLSHDPLSEQFPWLSTYNYCAGNPIMLVDPDGMIPLKNVVNHVRISSSFGLRKHPITGKYTGHKGVDLATAGTGHNVHVLADGKVKKIGWDVRTTANGNVVGYGRYIIVEHANGYQSLYAHLEKDGVIVNIGDEIEDGGVIAISGNTGGSTGPHLHVEIGLGNILDRNNKINPESIDDLQTLALPNIDGGMIDNVYIQGSNSLDELNQNVLKALFIVSSENLLNLKIEKEYEKIGNNYLYIMQRSFVQPAE